MTKEQKLENICEAILFANGEPLEIIKLAQAVEEDAYTVEKAVENLRTRLENEERGIRIVRLENSYQMCSSEKYAEYIKKTMAINRSTALSQAALETLAVIAYNQPITKSFADKIRGVDCGGVITTLVERGLIEEAGRLDAPGRPITYRTTDNFLRCFSLESLEQLPNTDYSPDDEIEEYDGERQMRLSILEDEKA
ncbi:MAG: SMC-Scp complex subunit ScpB [Oscillospiraceae bacterium]|nr:SMC-Scp complex subunit ScpB [Oscillospiraceae bacterium]